MKKALFLAALLGAIFGAHPSASAATTNIYVEDWGTVKGGSSVTGNGTLNLVGWSVLAVSQTAGPYVGIYAATGASDAGSGSVLPVNTVYFTTLSPNQVNPGMIYTTDASGAGSGGDTAFADIDPTHYTNLTLSAEVRETGTADTNYFAVQVGGSWYVAAGNPMPIYTGSYPTFTNATLPYTNLASVWNNLILTTTNVIIGPPASANLSGPITGIGIVELPTANGFNYNQLAVTAFAPNPPPPTPATITATAITPQNVYVGGGASFLILAAGTPPLTYIWETNGVPIPSGGRYIGTSSNTLTITNVNAGDASVTYSVIVTNAGGSATNSGLALNVQAVPPGALYEETFPYVGPNGNLAITGVGWTSASSGGSFGIYSAGSGLGDVFSYSGTATTNAYFTTVTNDTGLSGLPFLPINPASYPAVTFQANFTPGNGAGQVAGAVTVYWAVQMANGNWYSSVHPIPVNLTEQNNYLTNQLEFDTAAADWDNLTISNPSVVIGSQASSALAGNIIGAGLVFVHDDSGGDINFQDFGIVTNQVMVLPPTIGVNGSPNSQTAPAGGGVSFGVSATGAQPFTYGWTLNGVRLVNGGRISGATSPTLTIANLTTSDVGPIVAFVTNTAGFDESDNYVNTTLAVTNPAVGVLYSETFPFVGPAAGNYPISGVGWVEAVSGAPNALYETVGSDGAVFAYNGAPAVTAYYATTASDTNQAGLPFPNIGLAYYSNLTFSVDIAPSSSSSNVTAFLAVQLAGTNWYVAATALPVPTASDSATFSTYSMAFNPAAANWKNLTVSGSGALIGSPAASKLKGVMTGAGLVFVTVGTGGTFNFDNFLITGSGLGGINVSLPTNGVVTLSWVGNPAVNLQSSTNLSVMNTNWPDVPNTLGAYSLPVSFTAPSKFFRLVEHP